MLSEQLIAHMKNPLNTGELAGHNGVASFTADTCGDRMTVFVTVENGILSNIRFKTAGCWAAIAIGSIFTEQVKGLAIKEIETILEMKYLKDLEGLPEDKKHCVDLVIDAISQAIDDYKKRSRCTR